MKVDKPYGLPRSTVKENNASHNLKSPKECDCNGYGYCNICVGGLSVCKDCGGGEIDLVLESCFERQARLSLQQHTVVAIRPDKTVSKISNQLPGII